jgi:hypothetical protein
LGAGSLVSLEEKLGNGAEGGTPWESEHFLERMRREEGGEAVYGNFSRNGGEVMYKSKKSRKHWRCRKKGTRKSELHTFVITRP